MRYFFLLCLGVFIANFYANSQDEKPKTSIQTAIDEFAETSYMRNAALSIYVKDLNTKEVLGELNPNMSLSPASTMKIASTGAAIGTFGTQKRFSTVLQYDGYIDSTGVLWGNVFIKGKGDPSLGSKWFGNFNSDFLDQWVKAIQDSGIREIKGAIIGDASYFGYNPTPTNWVWGDMGNYYGAPANGLTIYDNLCELHFSSGENQGDSTYIHCVTPYVPEMRILNHVTAYNGKKDNAYIYGAPNDPVRFAEGSIPKNEEDFVVKASIPEPALVASNDLRQHLMENGIKVQGMATTQRRIFLDFFPLLGERKTIHTLYGARVITLSKMINRHSVNLFAEHLFRQLGVYKYGSASNYNSSVAVTNYWKSKGMNTTGFYVDDGSGLSRANAVSAYHLCKMLEIMSGGNYADSFKSTLSVAGKSGTLYSIGKGSNAVGNLMGKSGTMNRIKSYTGYVTSKSGRKLVFAIISNNHNCTSYQIKNLMNKVMIATANYSG